MSQHISVQRLCKRRQGEKHTLTVAEALHERKKQKANPKPDHKRVPLEGFKVITKGEFSWAGTGEQGGIVGLPRKPSCTDIFLALTPDSVVEGMIEKAHETRQKGVHQITIEEVREYWAVRVYLQTTHKKPLRSNWPLPAEVFSENPMGHSRFFCLHQLWIPPKAVEQLNLASEKLVLVPEVINIDEKLKPYEGKSPYKRYVPNKDPPKGHWITESVIKGKYTGLPYLLNCKPVQQNSGPKMVELYQSSLEQIAPS